MASFDHLLRQVPPLPADGPVRALGAFQQFVLLGFANGVVRALSVHRLTRRGIADLYAPAPWLLEQTWPRRSGRGWDHEQAAKSILAECYAHGIRDPEEFGLRVWHAWPGLYRVEGEGRLPLSRSEPSSEAA